MLKPQSFNLCQFLTLSVRNGPSVSFGTNVPCIGPNQPRILLKFSRVFNEVNKCFLRFYYDAWFRYHILTTQGFLHVKILCTFSMNLTFCIYSCYFRPLTSAVPGR